jgi:hypothetical protein
MPNCIVCKTPNTVRQPGDGFARYDCLRCGLFDLSGNAEQILEPSLIEVPRRRSLMSHTLRRMQLPNDQHLRIIKTGDLPTFWRDERLPTPLQQADNLILWVGDTLETPAQSVLITTAAVAATIGIAISNDGDSSSSAWLNSQLLPKGLYRTEVGRGDGKFGVQLTLEGWERYEALKKQRVESRTAFMAMKFNEPEIERAVNECFRPAVERTDFKLRVLTDQQGAGLIDNQIRAALLSARFVIADLTYGSHGAYWEAGFGEGRGIPVIYTCKRRHGKSTKLISIQITWSQLTGNLQNSKMPRTLLPLQSARLCAQMQSSLTIEAKQNYENAISSLLIDHVSSSAFAHCLL